MDILIAILSRVAKAAVTLLAIAVLNFFLLHTAPGDPAVVLAGEAGAADEQMIAQLRERFGLDQPFYVQLGKYVWGIVQFDLGLPDRGFRLRLLGTGDREACPGFGDILLEILQPALLEGGGAHGRRAARLRARWYPRASSRLFRI